MPILDRLALIDHQIGRVREALAAERPDDAHQAALAIVEHAAGLAVETGKAARS